VLASRLTRFNRRALPEDSQDASKTALDKGVPTRIPFHFPPVPRSLGNEVTVSNETAVPTQGVRCLVCGHPIHLSPQLADLHTIAADGATADQERQPHVLVLRCQACLREAPYALAEIVVLKSPTNVRERELDPRRSRSLHRKAAGA